MADTSPSKHLGAQAIVIGGSIAGLVAARILSDYFSKVTVIERDPRPEEPLPRKSAPQMKHAHLLLGAANEILETLHPGITTELEQAGALLLDSGADVAIYHYGKWKPRFKMDFPTIGCSRPFLEWHIRRRTEAIANIEIRYEHTVERLVPNELRTMIVGVAVKNATGESNLYGDLVVDAAGRGTRAPRWLEALGYEKPFEQDVQVDLAYTSRLYERPAQVEGNWKALAVYSRMPAQRGAFVFEVEGGRWIVSLPGYFKDHCPTDEDGFLEFARSLPVPTVYESIRNAKPLSDPVTHKIPSSRWFRYDKMKKLPERLIMVGDSVVSLNPLYGQGMMMSILGLEAVAELLEQRSKKGQGLAGLPQAAQKRIADKIVPAWLLSTTMDLRYPKAVGPRPFGFGGIQRIFNNLIDTSNDNVAACRVFYDVLHMRRGMQAIADPRLLAPLVGKSIKNVFTSSDKPADNSPVPSIRP
ncbi:MAG TPA: hypothetical protein PKA58_12005 [Polyangium sp.]|nr:hypothetical protein [Polyangium sp.]